MIAIMLGPPGAGKGTQAGIVCKSKKLFHFSTGNILRNEIKQKSKVGQKIKNIINAGKLVEDEIIIEIVEKIISKELSRNKGMLFDGFPRNIDQAQAFEKLIEKKKQKIDCVNHLLINKGEIIKRIQKRQLEENREDDNIKVLISRIDVYLNETRPLIDLYKKKNILKTFNGMRSINDISKDIDKALNFNN